ncbi:response regulator transcription factor [Roseateles sp.]|uniref:response regulator n=1 Tax=Roseateles sp. TaxID=1971397 RepID=UPI0025DDB8D3|nr:response regulator transcription factor [Roseateles sp.]MBV8037688.1 response regulator transcription factor [Roseateles sp.]
MQILLIEDDPEIRRELMLRWQSKGWGVTTCDSLASADRHARNHVHELVVLDLQLPDGDGLDWLRRWRPRDPGTPVLVLTARDRVADRVSGLQGGADDYLTKPFAATELDARIEALMRRTSRDRDARLQFGPLLWLRDEARLLMDGTELELHPREFEVLGLLIRRAPRLVPKRVIVDALAEKNIEVGDSAAEVYVSRLRRKLGAGAVQIDTVRGFGYRLLLAEAA